MSELHQHAQKYNSQLQEYNSKLQGDLQSSSSQLKQLNVRAKPSILQDLSFLYDLGRSGSKRLEELLSLLDDSVVALTSVNLESLR